MTDLLNKTDARYNAIFLFFGVKLQPMILIDKNTLVRVLCGVVWFACIWDVHSISFSVLYSIHLLNVYRK